MTSSTVKFRGAVGAIAADQWESDGDRGTVLLLHGGGQTRHSWHRSGPRFAAAGWTTLALDARGHGDSDWAPDGNYRMDGLVADLVDVIDQLGTAPVLIGASMGGLTSLVAAGADADLASALVLVDIATRIEPAGTDRILEFMQAAPDGFATLDEAADAIAAYNPHRPRPTNLDGLTKNLRQGADGRWRWHWDPAFLRSGEEARRLMSQDALEDAAQAVTVPTLLVRGAKSDVVTPEGAADLQRLIPHAVIREAQAGHMVAGDDNDVFAAQVVDFLDAHVPPTR